MKKILFLLLIIASGVFIPSCEREENPPAQGLSDGEGWLLLNFNASGVVEAQTKAHQSIITESQIFNMYIFIFDKNGNKIYGNFFGNENYKSTSAGVDAASEDCWWVKNATTNDNAATDAGKTSGKVRIKAPAGSNYELHILANLDADMVKISSDLLANNIRTKSDLQNFSVYMNAAIVQRSTKFAMSGSVDGVTVSSGAVTSSNSKFPLILERLDAKVKFIFKKGTATVTGQTIGRFEPRGWKVVNVPRTAYAIMQTKDHGNVDPTVVNSDEYSLYADKFFDTDFENFETTTYDLTEGEAYEFAFYMLENRQPVKNAPSEYKDRSRQLKTGEGLNQRCNVEYYVDGTPYSKEMKLFENANDFSTYVVVKGYVEMSLANDDAGQVLGGEVEFLIHLGDWNTAVSNFNTERNTSYTYTVTVNSVNDIRVEVESSKAGNTFQEPQPGATGSIVIAKEEIAICDAHYVSKTLDFHLVNFFEGGHIDEEHCIVDKMTWEVITPFSEGRPVNVGGIDIADHLDYKWAHFRLNKKDGSGNYYSNLRRMYTTRPFATSNVLRSAEQNKESAVNENGTTYSDGLAGYHNDGIMDIIQLVAYIKQQVKLWLNNPTLSDFDHQSADMTKPDEMDDPKISITVFVDEYYYQKHPITGVEDPYLWKYFVNTNPREIHILCNSEVSKDKESRSTGSVISIKQNPIQTIYNDDLNYTVLSTAWGTEHTDENNQISEYWSQKPGTSRVAGNSDESNGLINTCKEWGLCSSDGTSFIAGNKWHTFMDFEVSNDVPQLNDTYKYLRYSCMARNRDNNGDGIIDRDEVRWYMASIRQLVGFYVGNALLNDETKLYNKSVKDQQSDDPKVWWQHVISSTSMRGNSNAPELVWAEEGISTGPLKNDVTEYAAANSIRCVRNLGYVGGVNDESYALDDQPEDYISYENDTDGGYIFTATHLNKEALRYYSSGELISSHERATENRLYKKFAVYKENTGSVSGQTWLNFNNAIDNAIDNKLADSNPYCPDGYRAPNQLELAIMRYYLSWTGTMNNILSRTYYSFGKLGNPVKNNNYGFRLVSTGNVSITDEGGYIGTRCVKDIRVD